MLHVRMLRNVPRPPFHLLPRTSSTHDHHTLQYHEMSCDKTANILWEKEMKEQILGESFSLITITILTAKDQARAMFASRGIDSKVFAVVIMQ